MLLWSCGCSTTSNFSQTNSDSTLYSILLSRSDNTHLGVVLYSIIVIARRPSPRPTCRQAINLHDLPSWFQALSLSLSRWIGPEWQRGCTVEERTSDCIGGEWKSIRKLAGSLVSRNLHPSPTSLPSIISHSHPLRNLLSYLLVTIPKSTSPPNLRNLFLSSCSSRCRALHPHRVLSITSLMAMAGHNVCMCSLRFGYYCGVLTGTMKKVSLGIRWVAIRKFLI